MPLAEEQAKSDGQWGNFPFLQDEIKFSLNDYHFGRKEHPLPINDNETRLLASIQACKTRAVLTAEQAVHIFKIKLSHQASSSKEQNLQARPVARAFGISDKAVRDIWKGRTWLRETMHLDPSRLASAAARLRPPGRPKIYIKPEASKIQGSRSKSLESSNRQTAKVCAAASNSAIKPSQPPPTSPLAAPCAPSSPPPPVREPAGTAAYHADFAPPSIEPLPAAAAAALAAAALRRDAGGVHVPLCGHRPWGAAWTAAVEGAASPAPAVAAALPESSSPDDPFHDDWAYWP